MSRSPGGESSGDNRNVCERLDGRKRYGYLSKRESLDAERVDEVETSLARLYVRGSRCKIRLFAGTQLKQKHSQKVLNGAD